MRHKQKKIEESVQLTKPHFFYRRRLRNYRKRSHRRFYYGLCLAGIALLTAMASYSAVRIGLYLWQGKQATQVSNALRDVYRGDPTAAPMPPEQKAAAPAEPMQPARRAPKLLPTLQYPPSDSSLRKRFQALQRRNKDIIGWLSIGDLLDEAVVQRDNAYYLRRDYLGYHNVNGAIFLDEGCDLHKRPYTYILYGHNMKTQAMFGCLRHYEDPSFYRDNPIIAFDTCSEAGRYVVFSVATLSLNPNAPNFVDLNKLNSTTVMWREEIIGLLQHRSRYTPAIDVAAADQVLLLVTCKTEDSDERRIIAARRIRENENETDLLGLIQRNSRPR